MKLIIMIFLIPAIFLFAIAPRMPRKEKCIPFYRKFFAHRGLFNNNMGIPENSMTAFKKAVTAGYGIELDVQLTKDNQVVVFHDNTLSRVCGIDYQVRQRTYEELQKLTLLHTTCKIPLLSDVLKLVDGKVPLLIEIKLPLTNTKTCKYVNEVLENYTGNYCIQSFNCLVLLWYRRQRPNIIRGQLSGNLTKPIADGGYILSLMAKYLMFNFLGRPDFISYRYQDIKNISFLLNKHLFKAMTMGWTIDSELAYSQCIDSLDSIIFEGFLI